MSTKLTLTLDKEVIERSKRYAAQTGSSLSHLVESYLNHITQPEDEKDQNVPSELRNLFGAVKLPASLDHKKEFRRIVWRKKFEKTIS